MARFRSANLDKALELEDDPYTLRLLKTALREQLRQVFDLKCTYRRQKPEIRDRVLCNIRQQFPHLFEDKKTNPSRIRAVNGYAQRLYGRERLSWFGPVRKETTLMEPSSKAGNSGSSRTLILKPQSKNNHLNTLRKVTRNRHTGTKITSYFDSVSTLSSPISISSQSPPGSPTNHISTTSSSHLASMSPTINGPKYRISEVRNFLSTCIPDMQHLIDVFLDYGIRNREILCVLATQWSDEELDKLLKDVFQRATVPAEGRRSHGSSLVPEIDIQILKKHLQKSFIRQGSSI